MEKLWKLINGLKIKKSIKNILFLAALILIAVAAGGVLWLAVGRLFLPRVEWLFCFMGYPAIFIGLFGGILCLYNHEFA